MKNPVARLLWPEYSSPAPGRRMESRSAFFEPRAGRASLEGAAPRSAGAGCVAVESESVSAGSVERAANRSASGLQAAASRQERDAPGARSDLESACAMGTVANAAAIVRMRATVLVETPGDDEPEGIVPREGFRAHVEPDLGLLSERRVALVLHDAQDVHRADDAIHERPRDGGVRVLQEVITACANSAIEISVVLGVPAVPVRGDLSDVLIVLLTVVVSEVDDQAVLGGILVLGIGLDPAGVVPVAVGVGLELLLLGLSAVVIVEVCGPGHALQSQVNEPPLLSCVEMPGPRNRQIHEERFSHGPV